MVSFVTIRHPVTTLVTGFNGHRFNNPDKLIRVQ